MYAWLLVWAPIVVDISSCFLSGETIQIYALFIVKKIGILYGILLDWWIIHNLFVTQEFYSINEWWMTFIADN